MQGFKTYTGLVISLLGLLGISKFFSASEIAQLADTILQLGGLAFAGYGRYKTKLKSK